MNIPALFCIDSYKLGHMAQYPKNTEYVYSNLTPRSTKYFHQNENFKSDTIIAFGMYAMVVELFETFEDTFFSVDREYAVNSFMKVIESYVGPMGFDRTKIEDLWDLGYLPLEVKTLPEGARITPQIPVLTVCNTNPKFYWLTNFIETWLSADSWKPITTATIASRYREILEHYANLTGTDQDFVDFQGHDFSSRGMSGISDAARSGMGHLVFFKGTDNISANWYINQIYDTSDTFVSGSVPATEHSVMCMGQKEDEVETFRRLITETYPRGIVSIVSDTWDFWKAITEYASELKEEVIGRAKNNPDVFTKTVWRPDTGNPADIICGTAKPLKNYLPLKPNMEGLEHGDILRSFAPNHPSGTYFSYDADHGVLDKIEAPTPEMKGAVECLADIFGYTLTETNYKMLPNYVGLIYGDSITLDRAVEILSRLEEKGWASGNIVLGIGSYTYQYITRDTLGIAMKATWGVVNGEERELFKDPVTDRGKKSATGLLKVELVNDKYILKDRVDIEEEVEGELSTIFQDGEFTTEIPKLSDIRARARGDIL